MHGCSKVSYIKKRRLRRRIFFGYPRQCTRARNPQVNTSSVGVATGVPTPDGVPKGIFVAPQHFAAFDQDFPTVSTKM